MMRRWRAAAPVTTTRTKATAPCHRVDTLRQNPRVLCRARIVESLGNGGAQIRRDRRVEIGPAAPAEMFDRLFDRRRATQPGQGMGDLETADVLAFDQHTVEIENDGAHRHSRGPNSAVPIRTWVAPSVTAVAKSPDMPMLSRPRP